MIDIFAHIVSNSKQNGKLIFKNLGVKNIPKNNLTISFNDINYIDISENKFTAIPDIINEFQCLEVLFCSHNNIRSLSSNINNLIYLETLDLSCNHLTSIPSSICKLECLKILLISSNRLVSLPKSIGTLARLEELDASCNSLTCLPDELAALKQLKFLNLRHNKLLDVPTNLSTLSIEILDLSENQLSSIPSEYHHIETLQSFNLSGNPLTFPPANVCNRGLLHIMKYLQSESRRQTQRQHSKNGSQIDYSTLNNKSEPIRFDINPIDSVKSSSTASFPSAIDFEQDFDNECSNSSSKYHFIPHADIVKQGNFNRQDSGYNTINNYTKSLYVDRNDKPEKEIPSPTIMSNSTPEYTDSTHSNTMTSSSSKNRSMRDSQNSVERQFKKKNQCTTSASISQALSPQSHRTTRFNSRNRIVENSRTRRNSLPDNDYVTQTNNFIDHNVELSSECVVVVDNVSTNETGGSNSSQDMSSSYIAQSNNNNSSSFNKVSTYSSLRSMKSRNSDCPAVRKLSTSSYTNGVIPETAVIQNTDTKTLNQEAIKRFHKIIEAQLHVHINSKDLSEELSNGIYLCYLAKILIPNSIPIVHTPSPGQRELGRQKSKRNLENFLETCRRNGVSEDHLFSTRDVINCNPASLIKMANAVDALIHSIRLKKARPTSNCKPWRDVLVNPQTLSMRSNNNYKYYPRSPSSTSNTIYRLNKSIPIKTAIATKSKILEDDIIQISSEV